jgi:GNAT superfamily N-acetyltransferase
VDAPDHDDEGQARATPPFSRHASPIGMAINPAAAGAPMWNIRPGRDSDGPGIIALIGSCWSRYPGVHMDVDREMPELHALATYYYRQRNGALWVAEDGGRITGMIATRPLDAGAWEICRVYVTPALHGSGLGHALLDRAEHHAVTAGAERLALWSDTRFDRAHHFYEKHSYVRHGPVRVLNDVSSSLEFGYAKPLNGVELLDIAAATAAEARLADILVACAGTGASRDFVSPPAPDRARAFWHQAAADIGAGRRILAVGWRNGVMRAAGLLDLATPEAQRHRAIVCMLLVHPEARRAGLGRQVLRCLEQASAARNRSLLTLEALATGPAERFLQAEGWTEAGRIPDAARGADASAHAAIIFWKRLG